MNKVQHEIGESLISICYDLTGVKLTPEKVNVIIEGNNENYEIKGEVGWLKVGEEFKWASIMLVLSNKWSKGMHIDIISHEFQHLKDIKERGKTSYADRPGHDLWFSKRMWKLEKMLREHKDFDRLEKLLMQVVETN